MQFLVRPIKVLAYPQQLSKGYRLKCVLADLLKGPPMLHLMHDLVSRLLGHPEVNQEVQAGQVVCIQLGNDEVHLIEEGLGGGELLSERALLQLVLHKLGNELIHQGKALETGTLVTHGLAILV